MLPIAAPLRRTGLNVLRVDARNHGGSDSDTFSLLPRFAKDLRQAIAWLKRHHPGRAEQIAVLGHSVGAIAALLEASRNRDIVAVITIAAFAHPAAVTKRSRGGGSPSSAPVREAGGGLGRMRARVWRARASDIWIGGSVAVR